MSLWSETPTVFGGAFDPPHLGHQLVVQDLLERLGAPRVLILPSASLPHKSAVAPVQARLEMARICFQEELPSSLRNRVELCEFEVQAGTGPHYSFDTLTKLRAQYGRVSFVIGADQFHALPSWYRFPEVLSLAHWIVLERKPDGARLIAETLGQWSTQGLAKRHSGPQEPSSKGDWELQGGTLLHVFPTEAPALSSQQIRAEIALQGHPSENHLSPGILRYLINHQLYGIQPNQEKK